MEYILILSLYSKELANISIGSTDYDLLTYFILPLLGIIVAILKRNFRISKAFVIILGTFVLHILFFSSIFHFFKIFAFFLIFSTSIILFKNVRLAELESVYARISLLFVKIALVIWLVNVFFGESWLQAKPGLLDGLSFEPSHYSVVIAPYFFYTYLKKEWLNMLVVAVSLLLTFSATGFLAIFILSIYHFINQSNFRMRVALLVLLFLFVDFIPERVSSRYDSLASFDSLEGEKNATVVSLLSNLFVSYEGLKSLSGFGYEGFSKGYLEYYENSIFRHHDHFKLNMNSGHSLWIRLFGEFGVLGLFLCVALIWRLSNWKRSSILVKCALIYFVMRFFKLGGYFDYGLPLWFTILVSRK